MIDSSDHTRVPPKMVGFNLAARIRELEAEIKHLRKTIDSPLEEESWKADYGLLHALETSGLVCVARKWHAAYRKAQNSNLLRKQENEGLRADAEQYERVIEARLNVIDQQAAKIRELEADALQKSILCDSIAESKARAWQITEERKAAIVQAARMLTYPLAAVEIPEQEEFLAVISVMLEEAGIE